MPQPVAFFEVVSPDQERAQRFYRELFAWQVPADPELGGYALVDTGAGAGAIPGGIGEARDGQPRVTIYVRVDDLDAYLARAEQLGGKTLVPPTELPADYGRFAVFADPDGNHIGLMS